MREKVRLLIVNQSVNKDMLDLFQRLACKFGQITVITGNVPECANANLKILRGPAFDNTSYTSRLLSWMKFFIYTIYKVFTINGIYVLMLSSNPPILPFLGPLFKKIRKFEYIVQILDVYPDVLYKAEIVKPSHFIVRLWVFLNKFSYNGAETLITLSPMMAESISKYTGSTEKIKIIPTCVDVYRIKPIEKSENWFAIKHKQIKNLTILYSGNIGITHNINGLFEAARSLQYIERISFLIIGGGAQRKRILALAENLQNVTVLTFQSENDMPWSLSCGDVAIVSLEGRIAGISMPSKTHYMMASGNALLGLTQGRNDLGNLISQYECGLVADADDGDAVRDAVLKFFYNPKFLARCRENARVAAETEFSIEVCVRRYELILSTLLDSLSEGVQNEARL